MPPINLHINGSVHTLDVPPMKRLLDVLREDLHLTGTKEGSAYAGTRSGWKTVAAGDTAYTPNDPASTVAPSGTRSTLCRCVAWARIRPPVRSRPT